MSAHRYFKSAKYAGANNQVLCRPIPGLTSEPENGKRCENEQRTGEVLFLIVNSHDMTLRMFTTVLPAGI